MEKTSMKLRRWLELFKSISGDAYRDGINRDRARESLDELERIYVRKDVQVERQQALSWLSEVDADPTVIRNVFATLCKVVERAADALETEND